MRQIFEIEEVNNFIVKKFLTLCTALFIITFSVAAWGEAHCTVNVTNVAFSRDGNHILIYAELINDGDVNFKVTSVEFPEFHFEDAGGINADTQLKYTDLDIYIMADHYVEHVFDVNVTSGAVRRFTGKPSWRYKYYVRWVEVNDYDDEYDDYDDEED